MMTRVLISDANILIDMELGGLLNAMFRLACDFAVPDVLFEEELRDEHGHLASLGLKLCEIEPEGILEVVRLGSRFGGVSRKQAVKRWGGNTASLD